MVFYLINNPDDINYFTSRLKTELNTINFRTCRYSSRILVLVTLYYINFDHAIAYFP
ncbi:hypothetical protein [Calothrix sp. NIES-2100]|uniref:hypothetical protein n=1 Tax=Calothrix sp. NIES-2100 TaxID=1954172 RepID=UPI0030DCD05B